MRDAGRDFARSPVAAIAERGWEMLLRHKRVIAAALAALALSACVGVVVPVPLTGSAAAQDTQRNERR